jgi:UDP-3-O-[3-hydroxymyristoyl] glucosamine N-acyltransferase
MADTRFFQRSEPITLAKIAEISGAQLHDATQAERVITDVAPLDRAGASDIGFLDNTKYIQSFAECSAGACFIRAKHADVAPKATALLLSEDPYRAYALTAQYFYPFVPQASSVSPLATIDDSAQIGANCVIAAGAFIGRGVSVGDDCIIGANAVISDGVQIGHGSRVGALCSLSHTLVGERVIIHRGVHIGQDGFGFALGRGGHIKVPQLGRVVIENDVEIGAGTCIDRGTGPDTIIGEGTKIDNLVQIGHNVVIGKHCVIVAQVGVAGSTRIGDGSVIGGQVGVAGHLKVGSGVRIAAKAGVTNDLPNGASYGGYPAIPIKDWHRQTVAVAKLGKHKREDQVRESSD